MSCLSTHSKHTEWHQQLFGVFWPPDQYQPIFTLSGRFCQTPPLKYISMFGIFLQGISWRVDLSIKIRTENESPVCPMLGWIQLLVRGASLWVAGGGSRGITRLQGRYPPLFPLRVAVEELLLHWKFCLYMQWYCSLKVSHGVLCNTEAINN